MKFISKRGREREEEVIIIEERIGRVEGGSE